MIAKCNHNSLHVQEVIDRRRAWVGALPSGWRISREQFHEFHTSDDRYRCSSRLRRTCFRAKLDGLMAMVHVEADRS